MARSNAGNTNYQHRAWLAQSKSKNRGGSKTLQFLDLRDKGDQTGETVWLDWWQQQTVSLTLAATEAADTAALAVNAVLTFAATEGSDTAAFGVAPDALPVTLAATESSDTAAFAVNSTVALAATEASDAAAFAVNSTVALAATEASDVAALAVNETLALAVTEAADTADFTLELTPVLDLAATEEADVAALAVNETLALAVTEESDTADFAILPEGAFEFNASEAADVAAAVIEEAQQFARGGDGKPVKKRKKVKDPFLELEDVLDEPWITVPIEEGIKEILEAHDDLSTPADTEPAVRKAYTDLQSQINEVKSLLVKNLEKTKNVKAYEQTIEVMEILSRAKEKLYREESEVAWLLAMEIL